MNCELICVGTELLLGNILNTNARYLSEKCADLGLSMYYQTVVGDNPERLEAVVKEALSRSDLLLFSGGLGPTTDDLTKETVCKAFGLKLVEDPEARAMLEERMSKFGRKITENNFKQALIPEGQTALYNHFGTAPGILIEKDGKVAFLLPGPPRELIPMFEEYCIPYIRERSSVTIRSRMVKMIGIGESEAAARIQDLIQTSVNPTVAPYAKTTQVHLRITARAENEEACMQLIEPVYQKIKQELGEYIYTIEEDLDIEDIVVRELIEKGLHISCAESCTGGMIASRLINVAGASDCITESYITYSDDVKIRLLGVKPEIIQNDSAVSEQCAKEMAEGIAKVTGSDVGVSATGYAGPDGEQVGLVYYAVHYNGKTIVQKMRSGYERNLIREAATIRALFLVHQMLNI
ncbi:MAG: competence/damage-inducible protein A [Lachnospiraceae bacterium]|nr:competence/damage-inducible protein A [Lachnospiraceae bacterium]